QNWKDGKDTRTYAEPWDSTSPVAGRTTSDHREPGCSDHPLSLGDCRSYFKNRHRTIPVGGHPGMEGQPCLLPSCLTTSGKASRPCSHGTRPDSVLEKKPHRSRRSRKISLVTVSRNGEWG